MDENTQAEDADELYDLNCNLSRLLEGVANAVRGMPPPLTRWSFHDLPERVAEVVAQRDAVAQGSEDAARWLWWKPWIERRVGDLAPYERERIMASAATVPTGRQAAQESTDLLQELVSESERLGMYPWQTPADVLAAQLAADFNELRPGPLRTAIETYRATDSSHYGRMAAVVLAMMDELQPCGKHPHPVPYDPSASHVPPDYRDGWNAALRAVAEMPQATIDRVADLVIRGMPEGIQGFCKLWGWQQFARALGECLASRDKPPGAAPADEDAPSLWFGLLAKATGV
jgi:hypothetical protein